MPYLIFYWIVAIDFIVRQERVVAERDSLVEHLAARHDIFDPAPSARSGGGGPSDAPGELSFNLDEPILSLVLCQRSFDIRTHRTSSYPLNSEHPGDFFSPRGLPALQ